MYKISKEISGKTVSLFIKGLPKSVILDENTDQKTLEALYNAGIEGITKEKNGRDNKGGDS